MTSHPIPLMAESGTLLPPDLRADLGIVNVTAASPSRVRFRLDPGHMFLLRGQLRWDSRLTAGVWVQHRPDEQLTWVTTASTGPSELAGTLRELTGRALDYVPRQHWLDIYHQQAPSWTHPWAPQQFEEARSFVSARAREAGIACYLWREANEVATGNNPPHCWPFYSVTPIAEWSLHDGQQRTCPLETAPDLAAIEATNSRQLARLARRDRLITGLAAAERTRQRLRTSRTASQPRRQR